MTETTFSKLRLYVVITVTIAIESLLAWNYAHGGIPRHHILARKDLPEISNAWGGILLPLLTLFLTWLVHKRIFRHAGRDNSVNIRRVIIAFVSSLLYAAIMAVSFSLGSREIISNMMLAIFAIALFFPVYRAEYLLGLVLGLTFTFGAVLPTVVGTVLSAISAVLYLGVRKGVLNAVAKINGRS